MSELVRKTQGIEVYKQPSASFVSKRVAALWAATNTYGKPCDGGLLQAWEIVIRLDQISESELNAGVEHFVREGRDLPTPGRFAEWVRDQRTQQAVAEQRWLQMEQIKLEDEMRIEALTRAHPEREMWTEQQWRAHIRAMFSKIVERAKKDSEGKGRAV